MFWTCRFLLQQLPDNRILKLKLLKSKLLHCLPHATACILREMLINEARVLCFPKQSIINLLGWLHHSFTVESDCFDFERWFSSFQFTTVKCNTIKLYTGIVNCRTDCKLNNRSIPLVSIVPLNTDGRFTGKK